LPTMPATYVLSESTYIWDSLDAATDACRAGALESGTALRQAARLSPPMDIIACCLRG